jgi:hypothetical protein
MNGNAELGCHADLGDPGQRAGHGRRRLGLFGGASELLLIEARHLPLGV